MSRSIADAWARCRPHRSLFAVAVIVGSYGIGTVTAGVIRHDVPDAQYRSLAAQPQFDPVAYLVDRASAVVIDPRWILMTGHTITNAANEGLTTLTFNVNGTTYTSRELIPHPQRTPGVSGNFDIGLARLTAPVAGLVPATRYRGSSELGQVVTMVGFGRTGTGVTGEIDGSHGTKRAGQNVIDVSGPAAGTPTHTVWADFDNPGNPAASSWGSTEPLPLEYSGGSGDSGGGMFIDVAGQSQLAGIFFAVRNRPTQTEQVLANYGDINGFTLVSHFNEWIDEQISTPTAYWTGVSGGSFASAQNWGDAIAPGANHTVVFNIARTYLVALSDQTVNKHLRVRAGNVGIDLAERNYLLSGSPSEPSLVVGKSAGDLAQLTFKGGTVSAIDASIAEKSGATGRLTIDGANTSLVISDSLGIGGSPTPFGGSGTVRLVNGGMLDVRNTLRIGTSGTLDLADGAATVASLNMDGGRIIGAGAFMLDVTSGDAQINVTNANPAISAPIALVDNTVITVMPQASNLSITGGLDAKGVILTKNGAGNLTVPNVRAAGLTINAGTVAIAAGGTNAGVSVVGTLSIAGDATPMAKLDLTNNAAIVDYTGASPVVTIREKTLSGRGGTGLGGAWTGTGITSSTAATANRASPDSRSVGYAENSAMPLGPLTTFGGQPVDGTSVLIAYARTGDADLDGVVNDDDVTIVGATYAPGIPQPSWALGDFDYNGFIDDDDVTLLGAFYDPSAPPLTAPVGAAAAVAAVPEPSTLGLMLASAGVLLMMLKCRIVAMVL